jgi:hypothetical protein
MDYSLLEDEDIDLEERERERENKRVVGMGVRHGGEKWDLIDVIKYYII